MKLLGGAVKRWAKKSDLSPMGEPQDQIIIQPLPPPPTEEETKAKEKRRTVYVSDRSAPKTSKQKIEKELWWYDKSDNSLNLFRGSRLNFAKMEFRKGFQKLSMSSLIRRVGGDMVDVTNMGLTEQKEEKLVPKIEDEFFYRSTSQVEKGSARKWVEGYLAYNVTTAEVMDEDDEGVIVSVRSKELTEFLHNLDEGKFRYTVLE